MINLRGRVKLVIDLHERLALEKTVNNDDTGIIEVDMESKTIRFIVDTASKELRIPTNVIEVPLKLVVGINAEFLNLPQIERLFDNPN